MKRILTFLLASMLLLSSFTACGETTSGQETEAKTETAEAAEQSETQAETEAKEPAAYTLDKLTENGAALAHLVISAEAGEALAFAAEDFRFHIQFISGADVPVVHEAAEGSLPVVIGTPDTNPELETLFPDDLLWLRELTDENGGQWGSDGFAVRVLDGRIYIFGATERGAVNGIYDFIEENMGVIWIRTNEDTGIIYDENPTITLTKTDYREKSPFEVRGWHLTSISHDTCSADQLLLSRSKMNTISSYPSTTMSIEKLGVTHNMKMLVLNSPAYDPEVSEYWNTIGGTTYGTYDNSVQINFFSEKTAEAVAASILLKLAAGEEYPFIGIEDTRVFGSNANHEGVPFEYAPGEFVDPSDPSYLSTVYFTFINRVARIIKEQFPNGKIATFAYFFTEIPPVCELEDNVLIVMAPLDEDLTHSYNDPTSINNSMIYEKMEAWRAKNANMVFYNYYGCFSMGHLYTRPIWDRIKEDLSYYMDCGFYGLLPEGLSDAGTSRGQARWDMNDMTYWIYSKLAWDPTLDVDALIDEYCDKVYGAASEPMQEYYYLLEAGWRAGKDDPFPPYFWDTLWDVYTDCFLFNGNFDGNPEVENLAERILDALNRAWAVADDRAMTHIRPIKETMEKVYEEYNYEPYVWTN